MLNPLTLTFNDNRELEARFRRDQADGLRLYDLRAAALHFFTLMVAVWRDIWLCASSPSWEELRRRMTTETRLFGTERTHAFSLLVVSMIVLLVCNPKLRMSRRRNLYLTITRCLNASTCLLPITPASITPSGLTGGIMWLLGHTTLFPFSTPLPFREHLIISLLVLLVGMPFARGAYAPLGLCTGWKHYADQDATCNALFSWSQIARAPVLWFVLLLRDGMHSAPVWMHKVCVGEVCNILRCAWKALLGHKSMTHVYLSLPGCGR